MKFSEVKNLIQIYTKTHQLAPFKKKFSGGACPRTPLAKRMASPCAAYICRFANCKFPNLKKKFLAPLPNPGDAPDKYIVHFFSENFDVKNNSVRYLQMTNIIIF